MQAAQRLNQHKHNLLKIGDLTEVLEENLIIAETHCEQVKSCYSSQCGGTSFNCFQLYFLNLFCLQTFLEKKCCTPLCFWKESLSMALCVICITLFLQYHKTRWWYAASFCCIAFISISFFLWTSGMANIPEWIRCTAQKRIAGAFLRMHICVWLQLAAFLNSESNEERLSLLVDHFQHFSKIYVFIFFFWPSMWFSSPMVTIQFKYCCKIQNTPFIYMARSITINKYTHIYWQTSISLDQKPKN